MKTLTTFDAIHPRRKQRGIVAWPRKRNRSVGVMKCWNSASTALLHFFQTKRQLPCFTGLFNKALFRWMKPYSHASFRTNVRNLFIAAFIIVLRSLPLVEMTTHGLNGETGFYLATPVVLNDGTGFIWYHQSYMSSRTAARPERSFTD